MKAIRIYETGGPERLLLEEIALPAPGPGQARIKIEAIGVNYIDIYHRTGLYKVPLPFTPGMEAAGTVDAVGPGVATVRPGDRVAYAMSLGAYAQYALVDAWKLVGLPPEVDFAAAAAAMLQGMTAHYLLRSTFPLRGGETVLIHAAAGGVGLLLVQIARILGAHVIGTVSSPEKRELAMSAGADSVLLYEIEDFEAEVRKITDNTGVDAVFDSVGRATFAKSLNCLRPRGTMVLFGQSSGPVPPIDLNVLSQKGSLFVTRPGLAHYTATREELEWRAGDVLAWVRDGKLKLRIDRTYSLPDAAEAHRALEGRKTSGKVLLLP